MQVELLETRGVACAVRGMRLSRKSGDRMDTVDDVALGEADRELALNLIRAGDEHAKFARMIVSWIWVRAPRYWWQQMATYRVGVEWTSESTMYTLKQDLQKLDLAEVCRRHFTMDTPVTQIEVLCELARLDLPTPVLKAALPEGFQQTRIGMLSAQALRRIYEQRREHRLSEWQTFCREIVAQHPYPELLTAGLAQD